MIYPKFLEYKNVYGLSLLDLSNMSKFIVKTIKELDHGFAGFKKN